MISRSSPSDKTRSIIRRLAGSWMAPVVLAFPLIVQSAWGKRIGFPSIGDFARKADAVAVGEITSVQMIGERRVADFRVVQEFKGALARGTKLQLDLELQMESRFILPGDRGPRPTAWRDVSPGPHLVFLMRRAAYGYQPFNYEHGALRRLSNMDETLVGDVKTIVRFVNTSDLDEKVACLRMTGGSILPEIRLWTAEEAGRILDPRVLPVLALLLNDGAEVKARTFRTLQGQAAHGSAKWPSEKEMKKMVLSPSTGPAERRYALRAVIALELSDVVPFLNKAAKRVGDADIHSEIDTWLKMFGHPGLPAGTTSP